MEKYALVSHLGNKLSKRREWYEHEIYKESNGNKISVSVNFRKLVKIIGSMETLYVSLNALDTQVYNIQILESCKI